MKRTIEIQIGDETYTATVNPDSREINIDKHSDGSEHNLTWDHGYPEDLASFSVNSGWNCDCPDFEHNHAGSGSAGCKHIRSLASDFRVERIVEAFEDRRNRDMAEAEEMGRDYEADVIYRWAITRGC